MTKPLIKICGLTALEDAKAAIECGADWLGFIFVPNSPRALSLESAPSVLVPIKQMFPGTRVVGVFQNVSPETIRAHVQTLPLDAIQLHGDEKPEDFYAVDIPIIKVLLLEPETTVETLQQQAALWCQNSNVEAVLLDLPKGSGFSSVLAWPRFTELTALIERFPCIIAGGLTAETVEPVLAALQPFGVDVASGVEQSPGKKDAARLQAFCQAVKTFEPLTDSGESIPCNR